MSEDVKGGVVRDTAVMEKLQEALGLVDELREMEDLEDRLREVRVLEERLQEVEELAERIQGVIEEELGKEEVEKMTREEEIQSERSRVETATEKTAEEEEVDELEEDIQRVFFGNREVEERFESGPVDDAARVVVSQRKVRKTVTVVRESRQEQAETEQVSVSVEEETVQERQGWKIEREIRTTSVFEEEGFSVSTQKEGFSVRTQEEGFSAPPQESQVEDYDVWFRLFDRLPYKAVYKPQGMHPLTHLTYSYDHLKVHA